MEEAPVESADDKRRKQMEGVPDLPPLLAQILAETRAKQARARERAAQGLPPEEEEDKAKAGGGGKPGCPLLLEGPRFMTATHDAPIPKELSDSEESEDEAEPDAPPGPPDAAKCRAHGLGFSGAAAGQQVSLTITARDAAGKRVREGGAHILVMVEQVGAAAPASAADDEAEPIQAEVADHGNGTYTASYAVPAKGNYQLHIEVNGEPLEGSPFPVFFSAPVAPKPGAAAAGGDIPGLPPVPIIGGVPQPGVVTADAFKAASQQAAVAAGGALASAEAAASGAVALAAVKDSLGVELAQLGMKFPPSLADEQAKRMVVVGGLPPGVTSEGLKGAFSKCGTVRTCTLLGIGSGFAFLEFSRESGAAEALGMGTVALMGHVLKLELGSSAKAACDLAVQQMQAQANPYMAALQAQQMQQFQMLQQQQSALAQQVAAMRAAQRTGVAPAAAPHPHSNDSQKSAAIAAAIALSKKLAAGGGGAAGAAGEGDKANGSERRRRSRSRSPGRRRRSRSRSKDRRRRGGSRERRHRRSRSRDREGRRRHHKRGRRDRSRSKERRRERERGGKGEAEGPQPMETSLGAPPPAEKQQQQPKDELEELLEELGE